MIKYGTNIVGGVTPGKGGMQHLDKPVFNTMKEAVEATEAEASIIFVPPPFAADSIMEAADAEIKFSVAITDGIPSQDMIRVKRYMRRYRADKKMILTGPNCAGSISPGKSMMGIMPGHIYMPGNIGLIGRSGTLGYEAASQMKEAGIGISTSVGIGGDDVGAGLNIIQMDFLKYVRIFQRNRTAPGARDHIQSPLLQFGPRPPVKENDFIFLKFLDYIFVAHFQI